MKFDTLHWSQYYIFAGIGYEDKNYKGRSDEWVFGLYVEITNKVLIAKKLETILPYNIDYDKLKAIGDLSISIGSNHSRYYSGSGRELITKATDINEIMDDVIKHYKIGKVTL